jgi:hypothetical protein
MNSPELEEAPKKELEALRANQAARTGGTAISTSLDQVISLKKASAEKLRILNEDKKRTETIQTKDEKATEPKKKQQNTKNEKGRLENASRRGG